MSTKIKRNKKKILALSLLMILISILISPIFQADPDNVISFLPENIDVEMTDAFTMNINVTLDQAVDTCAVDNMTFNGDIITTESDNVTKGNRFSEGDLDDIITVSNSGGWIASIVWACNVTENSGTKTLANISWYAAGCGVTQVNMTAGGTALNGTANATTNHSCNVTVHPKYPGSASSTNGGTWVNVIWSKRAGTDRVIVENNSAANWQRGSGNQIYNGTLEYYNHTSLSGSTTYYYQLWSYNSTENLYSIYNASRSDTTGVVMSINDIFPDNESTEVTRPPANLSVDVSGTDLDVYIYFINMTPTSDTWTLVNHNSSVSNERVVINSLTDFGTTYEFEWGNHTYNWSVNITDGETWTNESYWFNTVQQVSGSADAWKDTEVDNDVDIFDCIQVYNWYNGGSPYNGFFDIEEDNDVDIFDVIEVFNEYN